MKLCARLCCQSQGLFASAVLLAVAITQASAQETPNANPILYVTQVPVRASTNTVVSIGGSHLADSGAAPRGGDLMMFYPDGSIKNLTRSAGYGVADSLQTGNAIAVRDPSVHWSGQRALFSMVVGAPIDGADSTVFHWQIYEVERLGKADTPVITKVPGQREDFNNIQPTYTSDGKIIFVSDHTLSGDHAIYPARNEQGGVSVTGLWSLDPDYRSLTLLDHSPSGSFKPFVDSYGRVVFSRWDHLQRDDSVSSYAVDYASEEPGATATESWSDIFPEALTDTATSLAHKFDLFLPWTMNQDGTGLLTMNHLGRHELTPDFTRARLDGNLLDFQAGIPPIAPPGAPTRAGSYLHLAEDPGNKGTYIATDAVTSAVSAGRLVKFTSPPDQNADSVEVTVASFIGLARDPYYLADGRLMGSFADGPLIIGSYGSGEGQDRGNLAPDFIPPESNPFRIRIAFGPIDLVTGVDPIPASRAIRTNYIGGTATTFSGVLWQLQPVEVVARDIPASETVGLPDPEIKMFGEAGVSPAAFKRWLTENDLALVVSRNVTARDRNDRQQPYNLIVPGGVSSIKDGGTSYRVTNLQFFQGDYVRGYKTRGLIDPSAGRRVTARLLHDDKGENLPTAVPSSAKVAQDGSTAMFVPAGRATTWQLTDNHGQPVVRERYWLTFKAGEMRSCANCHGNNTADQLDRPTVSNPPIALRTLLTDWNARHPEAEASVSPYQFWAEFNLTPGAPAEGDANGDGISNYESYVYGLRAGSAEGSSLAKPLTPWILNTGTVNLPMLTFTISDDASQLRVIVESSGDLQNWSETAVLENGSFLRDDGSVFVTTSRTPELEASGLTQVNIRGLIPVSNRPAGYFRLRFEDL